MRILSTLLVMVALAGPVSAQTSDEAGVRVEIEDQFADFRAGDLAGAFDAPAARCGRFCSHLVTRLLARNAFAHLEFPGEHQLLALAAERSPAEREYAI